MSINVSGFGLIIRVIASITFPTGITLTQFSDDSDPFDIPAIAVADTAPGLNGDLLIFSKFTPIETTINLIPGGEDDINMSILLEANRVGRGKSSANDLITLSGIYPSGKVVTLNSGVLISGMPGNAVASAGRLKTKPYVFRFENMANA